MKRRPLALPHLVLCWLVVAPVLLLGPARTATAQDGSLDLRQAGIGSPLTMGSPTSTTSLSVPLPRGVGIERLSGTVTVQTSAAGGRLLVASGTTRLAMIDLPARAGGEADLDVDLARLKIGVDHTRAELPLTFTSYPADDRCRPVEAAAISIGGLRLATTGETARPSSIADFLPPYLDQVDIVVPADADPSVAAAAVRLAGLLAQEYPLQTPTIEVVDEAPALAGVANARIIEFSGGGEAAAALANDTRRLVIDGTGDALRQQLDLLTPALGALASGRRLSAGGTLTPRTVPETQTLAQLGQGAPTASGPGTAEVAFGLDSTDLGGVPAAVDLHLVGTASAPVVVTGADPATLALVVGDRVLQTWSLGESSFDLTARIPADLLGRFTSVRLVLTAAGQGDCGTRPDVRLSLSGASTATTVLAEAPQSRGFADLPAALQPGYLIATDTTGVAGVDRAARMAVALQQLTGTPLDPQWSSLDEVVGSTRPSVLLLDGTVPDPVPLAVRDRNGTLSLSDGRTVSGVDANATFQVVRTSDRFVAVLSSVAGGDVDPLFDQLVAPGALADLAGDVAVLDSGQLRALGVGTDGVVTPAAGDRRLVWIVGGATALAVIAGAVVALSMIARRRRRA